MFANRNTVLGGIFSPPKRSTPLRSNHPSSTSFTNNENYGPSTNNVKSSTPLKNASSSSSSSSSIKKRRAFGDISNQRPNNGGNANNNKGGSNIKNKSNGKSFQSQIPMMKKSSSSGLPASSRTPLRNSQNQRNDNGNINITPRTKPNTSTPLKKLAKRWSPGSSRFSQRKPNDTNAVLPKRNNEASRLPPSHVAPTPTRSNITSRSQSNVLPTKPTTNSIPPTAPKRVEPVEEIEHPAGRGWKQQMEMEEREEDDIKSVVSLEGAWTMWEDWKMVIREDAEEEKKRKDDLAAILDDTFDMCIQSQLKDDAKEIGLECLLDFDHDSDVDVSHPYQLDKDSLDPWALPASSSFEDNDSFEI